MTCAQRDQDLLLLAHNALSLGERLRTLWHVHACARCRVRLTEFETVSRALATAIGGRPVHGAFGQIPIVHGPRPGFPVALILVTTLTLAVLAGVAAAVVHQSAPRSVPAAAVRQHRWHCKPVQAPFRCSPSSSGTRR